MKKINVIIIVVFILLSTACQKYLDVNKNVDAPDYVEGYLYLAGIQQAYEGIYWDNRALDPLTQMMGSSNGTYSAFAVHSYAAGSDAGAETWRMVYWNQGKNLENLINQSVDAEDWTLAGIGYAIKAFSWDMMTKINVDLPMKQAFEPDRLSHDYDYQKDIYPQVREWALKAIELLEKEDPHEYGTKISANDFIYGGDKSKWIKFAYAVLVRNLASLSNKTNFVSEYAPDLIKYAEKAFQSYADDATVKIAGGSASAPYSAYNNFWGVTRNNMSYSYFQHEWPVQVFTGTVPKYDEATGEKIRVDDNPYHPYALAEKQIICDTLVDENGHYDPRVAVKLSTTSDAQFLNIDKADSVKTNKYYGGSFTSPNGAIGTAPSLYGETKAPSTINSGIGRWLYRDDAPYILMTCAEIKFCLAEAYWKLGQKDLAFTAFKDGVREDMNFTGNYIYPGKAGDAAKGGDKISKGLFATLANDYLAGPYVQGLSMADFSISHIMMQKFVALYPWGASEAWVDQRKNQYDIKYTGDYPSNGNGWSVTTIDQKWDTDKTKVFKGYYLAPAQVLGRKGAYNINNNGAPEYRLRPRYNSEYMWNLASLKTLKPISGDALNYHTSIPWFAYPKDIPGN